MKDKIESRGELWGKSPDVSHDKKKHGDLKGKTAVLISQHPLTMAYVREATPKKVEELKNKYRYLNEFFNEKDKQRITGATSENIRKKAKRLSDEAHGVGGG
jgi:hypothetical protein